jgi:hypothetical protein
MVLGCQARFCGFVCGSAASIKKSPNEDRAFVEVVKINPDALRYILMLMALYIHLGPFSKRVISEIDRRIAELDKCASGKGSER